MKHITIIVPDGKNTLITIACISGAYEIFAAANAHWMERGKKQMFKIELAGISKTVGFSNGLLTLKPHTNISAITKTNLIIIPAFNYHDKKIAKDNKRMIDWIGQQYKKGAEIASICTGAFMLASAGLLDGKICSTHWQAEGHFRNMFPNVDLQPEKLITDEKGIYTNGGGYSFLNLMIYLVEKFFDRQTAVYCSKVFQIEIDRLSQSPFTIFTGQKSHGDEIVRAAQVYIENNLQKKVSVEYLSSRFSVSRRNFGRRFLKATGNTPVEYAQRVKIESAKKAFETSRKTINEVMYEVGYSDMKAFREVFRRVTGITPLEYRDKYNKRKALS